MKIPPALVISIGQAALRIRLKRNLRDAGLPNEMIELIAMVMVEEMLKEGHAAPNESNPDSPAK